MPHANGAYEHIFLDLDGTLTDPRDGIVRSIRHALSRLGRKPPEDCNLERFIGPPLPHIFRTLLPGAKEAVIEEAIEAYRERFAAVGIFENRPYPDLPETLQVLRAAGRRLYLLTVKPTVFAERILAHLKFRPSFHAVYGSDLADRSIDKAALLARALSAEELDSDRVVVVGDRADDVADGRRNGVAAIAVTWGYGSLEELQDAAPQCLVHTARELLASLGVAVDQG
jgi:phosphoglycolate phosphatase